MAHIDRLCLVPKYTHIGGTASFQNKFTSGLKVQGVDVCSDLNDQPYQAVLVIGGTRNLTGLWRAKRRGVPITQRLDGYNWIHRAARTGVRHFIRSEVGNFIMATIRNHIADRIVYQSRFVDQAWHRKYGFLKTPYTCIYNAVDLKTYTPIGLGNPPEDHIRILVVEGSFLGGHAISLKFAVKLAEKLTSDFGLNIELSIAGKIKDKSRGYWGSISRVPIEWYGLVPHEKTPELYRSAHILFSTEVNAACPNAVIEALACGLPVLAFDTGSLSELVQGDAGMLVRYGGDPMRLDPPDIPGLSAAAARLIRRGKSARIAARMRAESMFGLDQMVKEYLSFMVPDD